MAINDPNQKPPQADTSRPATPQTNVNRTATPRPTPGAGTATRPTANTPTPTRPTANTTEPRAASSTRPLSSDTPTRPTAPKTPIQAAVTQAVQAQHERDVQAEQESKAPKKEKKTKKEKGPKKELTLKKITLITVASTLAACILIISLCTVFTLPPKVTIGKLLARNTVTVNETPVTTAVGASYEDLGEAPRAKPVQEVKDGGLVTSNGDSAYPTYGQTKKLTEEERVAVIAENDELCARPTWNAKGVYDWMDENGYLYNVGETTPILDASGNPRRLYAHSGSIGLYGGNVSPSEPGVVKKMSFKKRTYDSYYNVTGVYAPAGEVIKVQMSEADMTATGGTVIHIGQALYNGKANNIWAKRDLNRMPVILNTMNMTKETSTLENGVYTCYVGSFLGGPVYIRDESVTFSVTISGAVNYPHFILGSTTKEKFEEYRKSSAPIFDLEVWESGVLHSGPKNQAAAFSYEDLTKAAVLWEKVALVSTKMTNQGIVFLYDPFVAAGAAVAFPGQRSVNCPSGWMASSLNYESLITSGAWGNFHEYHHNFQSGWGFGYTGEVTNNALNLVSYSLFTKISSNRSIGSYGSAGLSGWNTYTVAPWALNRVNTGAITDTNGLAVYATLLHNFGQDAFIKSKASGVNYLNKWAEITHQDFRYYAGLVQSYSGVAPSSLTATEYPAFVPVSCVYQTGRSYLYDGEKRYFQTMQPYAISPDEPFRVDLTPYTVNGSGQYQSGSIVIGKGFSYTIKNVNASAANGTFTPTEENGVYLYTPDASAAGSGKIVVTLQITDTGNSLLPGQTVDDVDLVLEFQHSHEFNRLTLQRTVYSYESGHQPTDAVEAFTSNYAGSIGKKDSDNYNVAPNSNTDVWLEEPGTTLPAGAPDTTIREENSVIEVRGKLKFEEAGKYRVALRGRWEAALFLSLDGGKTFFNAAHLTNTPNGNRYWDFTFDEEGKLYYDVNTADIKDPDGWLYFKSVLVIARYNISSYMGIGVVRWEPPLYHAVEKEDGSTVYVDESGNEVSESELSNPAPREPTQANKVAYASAYRNNYTFPKEFTSEYFYKKEYNYSYHDDDAVYMGEAQTYVSTDCPSGWGGGNMNGTYGISKMFDGQTNTSYISQWYDVSPEKPLSIVAKLNEPVTANYFNLVGPHENKGPNWHMPLAFEFYGSMDGEEWALLYTADEQEFTGTNKIYPLGGNKTLQYYKIVVTRTSDGATGRVGINRIRFLTRSYDITLTGKGGNHKSPDDAMFNYKGDWRWTGAESTFGHLNLGGKNATVDFTFEGTCFLLLTSKNYGNAFEVYIDGKKISSLRVKADDATTAVRYLSPQLSAGKHTVAIRSLGEMNIDSIALY